ncbi:MAG: flagellin [Gammaproteobacteria bacterium]|nr:flagellin [Gammaproteobacteria bacterium]
MPQIINTNIMSLNAQRNLNRSQDALRISLQRLSSGLRINSAKDDAAGLAISERFTSQIRGLSMASRNANDGISLAQVAEGALQEASSILQRVRELAVQSVNATNSASDRRALNLEVKQLAAELSRIAKTTEFNGQRILDGTFGTALFQVGANANQFIVASTSNFKTTQYGDYRINGFESNVGGNHRIAGGSTVTIHGAEGSTSVAYNAQDSAQQIADKINLTTDSTGVSAWGITEMDVEFQNTGAYRFDLLGDNKISSVSVGFNLTDAFTGVEALSVAAEAFNQVSAQTGVVATVRDDGSAITLHHYEGENIRVLDTAFTNGGTVRFFSNNSSVVFVPNATVNTAFISGQVIFDSTKSFSVQGTAAQIVSAVSESSLLLTVADFDVTSVSAANITLAVADAALTQVSDQRARFGALQSRFESTIRNLDTTVENLSGARSRIMDADFAIETAELTRTQILQQAGTAMLAQANTIPQNVLTLLQ